MNKKTSATFAITASLAVLVSGCAAAGTRGAQVTDEVRPAASAAVLGLAHGRVVVRDDLVSAIEQPFTAAEWRYIRGIPPATAERPFGDEAIRELKSGPPATAERPFSDEAIRELKSGPPATAERPFSDEAIRELKSGPPATAERPFSDEAIRELKSGPPATLSPLRDGGRSTAPQPDSVDDVLSPLSG